MARVGLLRHKKQISLLAERISSFLRRTSVHGISISYKSYSAASNKKLKSPTKGVEVRMRVEAAYFGIIR